ncbi:hypothetical protein [Halomonas daqiaonensis]|uniref:Uncharacterized protein n=1 Tax=Halomonas daqiaonensis TaxID=650850 RepID=A0A1H7UEN1_9GAMM|nr:hypothetical protein [Halomonas daqiaonensis]SEL95510.1 hypothetical protein SAMN04488129_12037 [Halomonas daqiaonensis]
MNLNQELLLRTQHLSDTDVLRGMGYTTADEAALAHLQAVRMSPYLGLEKTYRDGRYGERGFLEALCRCAALDEADALAAIEGLTERLTEDQAAFRHWLFADTDYVRGPGTPIFAMAFTEHFRRLTFPLGFWRLPWEERLAAACQKSRDHMQESGGKLVTWGEIQRYHYCFAEKRSIVISTTGEVIGEREHFDPPRATFGLKGSDENLPDLFVKDDE